MHTIRFAAASMSVLALTLSGCSSADVTGGGDAFTARPAQSKLASVERPWKGDCEVVSEITSPSTVVFSGTCQLAHLGRTTVLAYQTLVPGPTGLAFTNQATYTAANGDELHIAGIGIARPTNTGLSLEGSETAVGGTGRFIHATGTASLIGAIRFTGPTSTIGGYAVDGRLSY